MAETKTNPVNAAIKRGPLPPARFHDAVLDRNVYNCSPFAGTVLSDVMKPDYFASVANLLHPFDRIEVTPEDNTWWAELMVRDVGQKTVKTVLLRKQEFAEGEKPVATGLPYEIDFTPATKWRVIRTSDRAVISENHLTKDEAVQAAGNAFNARR